MRFSCRFFDMGENGRGKECMNEWKKDRKGKKK